MPHHSSSTTAHRTLMIMCALAALLLAFSLTAGWWGFFNERATRDRLARLSAAVDVRASLNATQGAVAPGSAVLNAPSQTDSGARPPANLADVAKDDPKEGFAELVPIPEPLTPERLSAVYAMLQDFWHAPSWTDKVACVRDADRVRPLMREYYEVQHNSDPVSGSLMNNLHFRLNGREVLVLSYAGSRPTGNLELALLPAPDGKFVLDWESYVGWGEMTFQDFKKQRPVEPKLMRVFAQRDDYYNYEFSDPEKFFCLQLLSPDGLFSIHGYAEKNSGVGAAVTHAMENSTQRIGLTLRLAFPEKAQSDHCVRLVGLVADRWLVLK